MSSIIGTVRGSTIELEGPLPALDGKRVRVVVEEDDDPVERAIREAPLDDLPTTDAERAAIAEWRAGRTQWVPSADVRAKVSARLREK